MLDVINFPEAQKNLETLMADVTETSDFIVITHENMRPAVLMSLDDYKSLEETAHILSSPANAKQIREGLEQIKQGKTVKRDLIDVTEETK
ncbi:MAG: type II toxin-antitoxin system prevent-host-death family antitoxin [Desulfovibrio sp.]|jgi:antitoxin YefM|nr:type II toxin-antitoxin system prevent-host-death family antitoxin [Desulfovibrio sp.]